MERAQSLLEQMRELDILPDRYMCVCVSVCMQVCMNAGLIERALSLLEQMRELDILPGTYMCKLLYAICMNAWLVESTVTIGANEKRELEILLDRYMCICVCFFKYAWMLDWWWWMLDWWREHCRCWSKWGSSTCFRIGICVYVYASLCK